MSKPIVLIHGAWLNSASWAGFNARYEAKGHPVVAPDWPFDDRPPAELRATPRPELASTGQKQILAHLERIVRAQPEPPILIGHSLGGVFVQHLLDHGVGAAGVAIHPAPTPGVPLGPQAIRSALPVLGDPLSRGRLKWNSAQRAPLLLIAGGKDLIADASMTKAIYNRQKRASSLTELKLFPDRSHWTCLDRGWEAVANHALDWATRNARGGSLAAMKSHAA